MDPSYPNAAESIIRTRIVAVRPTLTLCEVHPVDSTFRILPLSSLSSYGVCE